MQFQNVYEQVRYIVTKNPEKIALQMGECTVSYQALDEKTNQLANFLYQKMTDRRNVPIFLEKRVEIIEAMLGVMKSGGIFVPLDPELPENRMIKMMTEIDADWVICSATLLERLDRMMEGQEHRFNVLLLKGDVDSLPRVRNLNLFSLDLGLAKDNQVPPEAANKHSYIYFTSGSTGNPKAILGRHRSLKHFIDWEIKEFAIDENIRVSQLISPSFDPFLRDVFVPLCVGGTLCIPENRDIVLYPQRLNEWLDASRVNLIHTVPTIFKALMAELEDGERYQHLRYILLAGELLRGNDVKKFFELFGERIQLVNLYGPTETTMVKLFHRVKPEDAKKVSVPIGKPIEGAQVMILNEDMEACVPGVIGEIYIRTPFITSGYYNDRELTKKVFIPNPFTNNSQDIIYKTGDLGRIFPNEDVEVIGRIDQQVKIRGVRVELGEIENQLLRLKDVKEAVVVAREDGGNTFLTAYLISDQPLVLRELREELAKELPEVMIPANFMQIAAMPLTPNGKIDRKALPEPELSLAVEYVAPSTPLEAALVKIWSKILRVEGIGVEHNFFDLGGHSIKATAVVTRVHKELQREISLKDVFQYPTIRQLAARMEAGAEKNYTAIQPVAEQADYPVSSAQRRLYVLNQLEESASAYNMPRILTINGHLERERLESSLRALIQRHEALRTTFYSVDGEIRQKVHREVDFAITYSQSTENEVQGAIREFFRPFDLEEAPLLRVNLIQLEAEKYVLLFDTHHIVSDGSSMDILVRDFVDLYQGRELPPLPIQYKDFAVWQNQLVADGTMQKQEEHWLQTFATPAPVLTLPYDYPRPVAQSFEGDRVHFRVDPRLAQRLTTLAKANDASLFMVLLAAYNVLLSRYANQEDIVVGAPTRGRSHMELENIIGMFINSLPMRNYPHHDLTFKEFFREVKANALKAFENEDYQFEQLVNKLNLPRDLSRNPIFDTIINLHNYEHAALSIEGVQFGLLPTQKIQTKFDLTLNIEEGKEQLGLTLEYCTKLFRRATIERMAEHLQNILTVVTLNPEITLGAIDLTNDAEREQILMAFNDTQRNYPREKNLAQLFAEQVNLTPDAIALVCLGEQLTYRELDEKTSRLASLLRRKGVRSNQAVGLIAERSVEMVIGIVAIIKAGGAYLPIDLDYPEDRMRFMLEDSSATLLLVPGEIDNAPGPVELVNLRDKAIYEVPVAVSNDEVTGCNGNVARLDGNAAELGGNTAELNGNMTGLVGDCATSAFTTESLNSVSPRDLAYIMYTSGSTGQPKGVMIEHRGIVRLVKNTDFIEFTPGDRLLQTSALVFDVSTYEIWGALLNGMELHLAVKDFLLNPEKMEEYLFTQQINSLFLTTSLFNLFADERPGMFSELTYLVTGGEAISPKHCNNVLRICKNLKLVNGYGPTENTTFSTSYLVEGDNSMTIPIGKPLANSTAYIFDPYGNLCPIGVPGEICVGGDGVARGYLNNPTLTAEKFIENPFKTGEIIYRTGDLGKWLPDGNIDFGGRLDQQVKIRGFRIEPGEIENHLLRNEAIKEAVVLCREDARGQKYLCAYVVPEREITPGEIRTRLAQDLPDYMVPSHFVLLKSMPLTVNGKIDRKALPEPESNHASGARYEAPCTEVERQIVAIWQEVLGIEQIGITDNFFELGGHSLKATLVASKIHKALNVELPLTKFFQRPTVKAQVEYIVGAEENLYASIKPLGEREFYPISSAQKRLYIQNQFEGVGVSYNLPGALRVIGELDRARFAQAFKRLVERHETLRTSFAMVDGEVVQRVEWEIDFQVNFVDASSGLSFDPNCDQCGGSADSLGSDNINETVRKMLGNFVRPFDLSRAPLCRVELVQLAVGQYVMLFDMHHIISDGVSMENLVRDFAALYQGQELAPLRIQYKDFASWQNQLFQAGAIEKQAAYWQEIFADGIPVLNMPTDYPRPALQSYKGNVLDFAVDLEVARRLKAIAREEGATLYMLMLAAYNVLLSKYTRQEDIVVGSPIAGRRHADLQQVIGMFVNMIALRNAPTSHQTFREFFRKLTANTLGAFDNQDYQFEELLEKLHVQRDLSRNPLFDVVFSLQDATGKGEDQILATEDLQFLPCNFERTIAKFDLTLAVVEKAGGIDLSFEYCTDLFARETIERMAGYFTNILRKITEDLDVQLAEIDLLSAAARKQLLEEFNATEMAYASDKTLHELFAEQAALHPERTALIYLTEKLTYAELNIRANQLAYRLRQHGMLRDEIVAIMAERSIDMIVAILGVLKSGGAYMPVDPDYPEERISYMLQDSGTRIMLTQRDYLGWISSLEYQGLVIDLTDDSVYTGPDQTFATNDNPASSGQSEASVAQSQTSVTQSQISIGQGQSNVARSQRSVEQNLEVISQNPVNVNVPNDLAYVMYTSGSTGKPKGVMIEHRGVVSLAAYYNQMFGLEQEKHILHMSNVSFDTSIVEIFPPLLYGSTVYIIRKELALDREQLLHFVEENQINFAQFVPLTLQEILGQSKKPACLEHVIVGSDRLEDTLKDQILALGYRLTNHYGPTEGTVDSLVAVCEPGRSTIGRPIANTRAYILDKDLRMVLMGVPGELCIAGVGLARGYLNQPELTADRFIVNPWVPGERMYRTGDLASWQPDGQITFHGRIDNQVKIRGYRIEPGEIELQIQQYLGVKNVVVIDHTDPSGAKYLAAYLVADQEIIPQELRTYLAQQLPDYMIPSYFIQLDEIPLTHNGKVNRLALPVPEKGAITGTEYVAPANELEEKLAIIWQDVLGVEPIGREHNFFELGGHSLKAMTMVSRMQQALGVQVPFSEVFKNPTIKMLAQFIQQAGLPMLAPIRPAEEQSHYPLSSSQRRLFIQWQVNPQSTAYNMPSAMILEGQLEPSRLTEAIQALVQRHEALRTSFELIEEEIVQRIHPTLPIDITYLEYAEEGLASGENFTTKDNLQNKESLTKEANLQKIVDEFVRPFDLTEAPLIRVGLIKLGAERHLLIFDMHHIISDGVSHAIMARDFTSLYAGEALPALKVQYKDYAIWHNNLLASANFEKLEEYWIKAVKGFTYTELPTVKNSTGQATGKKRALLLDEMLTERISLFCQQHQMTKFAFVLGIFKLILMQITHENDITLAIPSTGRGHEGLEDMVGVFLNIMISRTQIDREASFKTYLTQLRDDLREAQSYQDYPYESLYAKVLDLWNFRQKSLFSIIFNYMPYQTEKARGLTGITIRPYQLKEIETKCSLALHVNEGPNFITLSAFYENNLDESLIEMMLESFPKVSEVVLTQTDQLIKSIPLATDESMEHFSGEFEQEFDNAEFF